MAKIHLRLVKRCAEFLPREEISNVPHKTRGIYVLYKKGENKKYDVLYVGMADTSIRGRLRSHVLSRRKKAWTHFSIYEVWPNITVSEIKELEGLFRHIYRRDTRANIFNLQRGYQALRRIRENNFTNWKS